MESTKIAAEKTAAEIGQLLSYAGATKIMTEYANKEITGLVFVLPVGAVSIPFVLPVRTESIFTIINKRRKPNVREKWVAVDREQAGRIAWRQLLRWVQAQLALIETGMVKNLEVFLPYARMNGGQTFFEKIEADGLKLLPYEERNE